MEKMVTEPVVMVTGGRGYVGGRVLDRLAARGIPVVSYDRDPWEGRDGVVAEHGELTDVPRLLDVIRAHGVGRIVHTAAISHPGVSLYMPLGTFEANVAGTVALLEAARIAQVPRVVNFSSSSVYGHVDGDVTEDLPLRPISPYGVTKVATDLLGPVYRDLYGVEVYSLRVTWVYGPGNRMQEYVRDMLRAALRGERYALPSGADHPLPLVHVEDVADATVLATLAAEARQPAYNVTGPELPTLGEVAEQVRALVPGARIEIGPGDLDLHRLGRFDMTGAARDFGYAPTRTLADGLPGYLDWLREHDC
ncbi:NAD-dependent epimerase/dehydratase family protein [Conexibacter arvalis]|uniref:Nucleoside-diphosphate-sugar epimerase n=1 Tax=Conexibacter arvalis TaxID=912552 RepID=A0A840IDA1_9ACTN|nr:NAD(P)-dependent oxidoreductase [Conexibacter arvalis]MBB4662018.1 nucleoside-diphosphate-sugar epimerase [Conexibacter arvalis]